MDDWRIERLDRSHGRGGFQCGEPSLDAFLRSLVSQYEKRKLGRTYVAVRPGESKVCGYYTLAASSLHIRQLPPKAAKKLPNHPVPAVLLGRLAVDQASQGHGLGAKLLIDALKRCLDLSESVGIHGVVVMPIDDRAKTFYLKYGFTPLAGEERLLYVPLSSVENLSTQDGGSNPLP